MADAGISLWLQTWYKTQCDGEREHQYGVRIDTLDNPGWSVKMQLRLTHFASSPEREIRKERAKNQWIVCRNLNQRFERFGDAQKLTTILQTFRQWIETVP